MQLAGQGGFQVRLQELALPSVSVLKVQVHTVTLVVGHGIIIGEEQANLIYITPPFRSCTFFLHAIAGALIYAILENLVNWKINLTSLSRVALFPEKKCHKIDPFLEDGHQIGAIHKNDDSSP